MIQIADYMSAERITLKIDVSLKRENFLEKFGLAAGNDKINESSNRGSIYSN